MPTLKLIIFNLIIVLFLVSCKSKKTEDPTPSSSSPTPRNYLRVSKIVSTDETYNTQLYTYNEEGQLTQKTWKTLNGTVYSQEMFRYSLNNLITSYTQKTYYDSDTVKYLYFY